MKTPLCLLAFAVVLCSSALAEPAAPAGYDGPPERLHIYLLIGQSNMAGRAQITDAEKAVPPRTLLLNAANNWEPATHPFNQYSTIRKQLSMQRLGPGYNFAKVMTEAVPSITVGLIVNARGGSSIKEWQKGQKAYQDALERARAAKSSGQLRGILWHQGESDASDADYLVKLVELIANFRTDLELPKLPFVAGQVNNVPLINEQVAKLPDTVPFTRFVSSEGLTAYDRWHFDTESALELGKRYAEQMIELQKEAAARR